MIQKRITLLFLCVWCTFVGMEAQEVNLLEYWFDDDATSRQRVMAGSGETFTFEVDANVLPHGIHTLSIRIQDGNGQWGTPLTHYFLRTAQVPQAHTISQYEYWIDHDGRNVQRTAADTDGLLSLDVDVDTLSRGIHALTIRAQDDEDQWSAPITHYFYHDGRLHESRIIGLQYWFNEAYDHAIYLPITPGQTEVTINRNVMTRNLLQREPTAEEIESGEEVNLYLGVENELHVRFQDDTGAWGQIETDTFIYMGTGEVMILAEGDWQLLRQAHDMTGGDNWTATWEFGETSDDPVELPGVTVVNEEGHVTAIDLSSYNLCGPFPHPLLQLPALKTLNVSQNHLHGDISCNLTDAIRAEALQTLNIADNQLTGNVGLLAAHCPQLTTLDAQRNHLESVHPFISPMVTSLNLGGQTIDSVSSLHIGQLSAATITTALPSILTYDHAAQCLSPDIDLACITANGEWKALLTYQDERLSITPQADNNTYYGISGDTLLAMSAKNGNTTLPLRIFFDKGDGNMDGQVDVLDLQTDVNVIMEKHGNRLFNFTAANLWADEQINAQDAVVLVNLLLSTDEAVESRKSRRNRGNSNANDATPKSVLCLQDGHLLLYATKPVAAFDITLLGATDLEVAQHLRQQGFICTVRQSSRGMRLIAYSLSGNVLPIGSTLLATVAEGRAIATARLADAEAQYIDVIVNTLTTGIEDIQIESQRDDSDCYDLSGRRMANRKLKKGIYIRQNQKLVKR